MKEILYSIAKDSENKICVAAKSSKNKNYFCVECDGEMILRKSERRKRRPHFAHKNLSEDCTPESALHKFFKVRLYELIKNRLLNRSILNFSWRCDRCNEIHEGNLLKKATDIKLERYVGSYRPDIVLYDIEKNPFVVIEIVVTHSPELEVKKYYKENNITLIIFEPEDFRDALSIEEEIIADFVDLCINPVCKKHNEVTISKLLKIVETHCWRCASPMKAAIIDFEYGIGPENFTTEDIKIARQNGVLIEKHYSQGAEKNYMANTCGVCKAFIGEIYLNEFEQLEGKMIKTGYLCKDCYHQEERVNYYL